MRLLLLGPFPPEPGGVAAHVRDSALALAARGHQVTVLARRWDGDEETMDGPLRLLRLPDSAPHRLRWLARVRREGMRSQVVHAHTFRLAYLASLVLPPHVPLVFTVHAYFAAEMAAAGARGIPLWFYRHVERRVLRRASAVVAVDRGRARWARQAHRRRTVLELPNCLWLPDYPRPRPSLAERRWEMVCPRRLYARYGVEHAIRALSLLRETALALTVTGDGPLRPALERLSRELGLDGRVSFVGALPRRAVVERLREAAVALVPSIPWLGDEEATSIAALESMAVGTPVVASRSGGLAEVLQDGVTGLLVEPGDASAIADAVRSLLADSERWRRLALRAREYVEERHNWLQAAAVLEQLYATVAKR